jgi:hypothetical protein
MPGATDAVSDAPSDAPGGTAPAATAPGGTALATLPGVLRIGAETLVHTGAWTAAMYARGLLRVARAVVDPASAASLSDDLAAVAGSTARVARSLGARPVAAGVPGRVIGVLGALAAPALEAVQGTLEQGGQRARESEEERLRRSGSELLRRSRDVWTDESRHPAYDGLLRDLAPDEARLLVLLLRDGPQPSVDVRTGGAMGRLQPRIVARGLTMIGPRASVRYQESVPAYLNNLTRLGLIWQSPEPLADLLRYQVLEAQPDVLEAKYSVRRATLVRRSIHLTPFGSDFTRICFATEVELEAGVFPAHDAPPQAATESVLED